MTTPTVLLNGVVLGHGVAASGLVTSDPHRQATIAAAGGVFAPTSNPMMAVAAARANAWRFSKGRDDLEIALMLLAAGIAAGSPMATMPYTQASPLTGAYTMQTNDLWLPVAAGAVVTLPASPLQVVEYRIKVVSGTAEDNPVQLFAGGSYSVEDPGASEPYTLRASATPATLKVSGSCSGWTFDGAVMSLVQ